MTTNHPFYTLIDSGDLQKLERFGSITIARPSSMCSWKPRVSAATWQAADATYSLDGQWIFKKSPVSKWDVSFENLTLELQLQSNGQIGLFPEHSLYLHTLGKDLLSLHRLHKRPIRVLNLFAYTGLATVYAAATTPLGSIQVTHVDLAKKAIEWAKENAAKNNLSGSIRWIVDDALGFMARELRKNLVYDVLIIDPPSFSRVSKNNTWTLDEKLPEIMELCLKLLSPDAGSLFLTNHSTTSTSDIARNLILDHFENRPVSVNLNSLALPEENSERKLPAGSLIQMSYGI